MKQQKPLDPNFTTKGTPRKNAPGAGRPPAGRSAGLPRVTPATHALFVQIQDAYTLATLADAVELAARFAARQLPRKRKPKRADKSAAS